jgi:M6 family metalloprotease-like protein
MSMDSIGFTTPHRSGARLVLCVLVAVLWSCRPMPPVPPPTGSVALAMPSEALYVGSYVRIGVDLRAGVRFDDLEFRVDRQEGGWVSESRDATFSPRKPHIMLIAGYAPGSYTLLALRRGTNTVLARGSFATTVEWDPQRPGPSFVQQDMQPIPAGQAWGGGPAGRQNVAATPVTGTRRIALVFVDTSAQRYPTGTAFDPIRDNWQDNIIDGVNVGGVVFSTRDYYRQASQNQFDLSMQVFGPYDLPGNLDSIGPGANWVQHTQAGITAADADIDYRNFDTVLVVSQTIDATATTPLRLAWPTATIPEWNGWVTADGVGVSLGTIQMPFDWTARDGRQVFATASHEMGHNLGLGDQYDPVVAGRNPGDWELMHAERQLPELTLAHKLMLGWVDPAWVQGFNFASSGTNIDQTSTLRSTGGGAPAAGSFAGAEVRIADGLNYYFEHRRMVAARIADRSLPTNDRVLITDVSSAPFTPAIARPTVLLAATIPPSAGPVLGNGSVYRETDTTSPVFPVDFRATASNFTGSSANVRIQYGINGKPDPSIRPWGAPPWQTPDIEVRNARNAVDAAWFNVPWQGNPNTVVAHVRNGGNVAAPGVQVNFFVRNYNVGGAPETFLGSDTRDIPPNTTVEFTTGWTPPTNGHYCIVTRIPLYQTPAPTSIVELTEFNNVAQSNYDRFISPTASPAERRISSIEVGNPFSERTRVFVDVRQTNPLYRTYLEHKWLDLDPGETQRVEIMFEYVGALPPTGLAGRGDDLVRELVRVPNEVSLQAFITDPADKTGHVTRVLGGAGVTVVTGQRTDIEDFRVDGRTATGRVTTAQDEPVTSGAVLLTFVPRKGPTTNGRAELRGDGSFSAQVPPDLSEVSAYYVPTAGFGDAVSTVQLGN